MKQDAVNQDPVTVKDVNWPQALPAVWLLQTLRLACGVQTMLPVVVGLVLLLLINSFASRPASTLAHVLGGISETNVDQKATMAASSTALSTHGMPALHAQPLMTSARDDSSLSGIWQSSLRHAFRNRDNLIDLRWLRHPTPGLLSLLRILIVAWMGVAVTAAAAHSFCRDRRLGAVRALQLAVRLAPAWGTSTLIAGMLLGLLWTVVRLTGWAAGGLMSVTSGIGSVTTFTWMLSAGLTFLLLLLGIVVISGWFLSLAAIAIDRCSGADALSRGICYCLAHRTRTMLYVLVVCCLSVGFAGVTGVIAMQAAILAELFMAAEPVMTDSPSAWQSGTPANFFVTSAFHVILVSSVCSGTGLIYLLLRQKEDGVALREYDEKSMARSSR